MPEKQLISLGDVCVLDPQNLQLGNYIEIEGTVLMISRFDGSNKVVLHPVIGWELRRYYLKQLWNLRKPWELRRYYLKQLWNLRKPWIIAALIGLLCVVCVVWRVL